MAKTYHESHGYPFKNNLMTSHCVCYQTDMIESVVKEPFYTNLRRVDLEGTTLTRHLIS